MRPPAARVTGGKRRAAARSSDQGHPRRRGRPRRLGRRRSPQDRPPADKGQPRRQRRAVRRVVAGDSDGGHGAPRVYGGDLHRARRVPGLRGARCPPILEGALRGRAGHQAVTVARPAVTGVSCQADAGRRFDSASIVKAVILAALLRWHQETGHAVVPLGAGRGDLMITRSDNDAASELWNWVGLRRLQRFLSLATMKETELGPGPYWGLTQATAHDEMLLLGLLARPNVVLSAGHAPIARPDGPGDPGQRWGTPAGAPAGVTVHVKNGWLPDGTGWHINSIGAFTGQPGDGGGDGGGGGGGGGASDGGTSGDYLIAVLTDRDPTEGYGIDTVEGVARVVHRVPNTHAARRPRSGLVRPRRRRRGSVRGHSDGHLLG